MHSNYRLLLALLVSSLLAIGGCGSDDDDPAAPPAPEDPRVETVEVAPDEATLDGIGDEIRFDAVAFDQNDAVIDTVFTWNSSDDAVVVVDQQGNAVSTGLGTASIYVTAGAGADTAQVTVTLDGATVVEWIASGSGDWEDGANWSGGEAPGAGDVALIAGAGTWTVTVNGDADVEALVLGDGSGSPTLDLGPHQLSTMSGGMYPGAQLIVEDEFTVLGDVVWSGGDVSGGGDVSIVSGAELHLTGNPVNVDAVIDNSGTLVCYTGSSLRVDHELRNNSGGLVDLQGDAFVSIQFDGFFGSTGTIRKSQGEEEASIVASSLDASDFESSGNIRVEEGTLKISEGSIQGRVTIAEGTSLRQSGNTIIPRLNCEGGGDFVITGRVSLGTFNGQVVDFLNLVLDSTRDPVLSGPASALVNESFVWRQGMVALDGNLSTQIRSHSTFEGSGSKVLRGSTWRIAGDVEVDSNFDLNLREGAVVSLENQGTWTQNGAGSISQGSGDQGRVDIYGSFAKTGEGTFNVDADLNCYGTMDLRGAPLVARGAFLLVHGGVLTGGGTADLTQNLRLNVVNASSATIQGTIRPDLDGGPARFDIQGSVVLSSDATIALDVITEGDLDTESVYFLTSGPEFNGTLDLNVLQPPDQGSQYKVIHSNVATGLFEVEGGQAFTDVVQDGLGVVCYR